MAYGPVILVYDPHVFVGYLDSRPTGEEMLQRVDPRFHLFVAIILVTIGSTLMGLQVGGFQGILGVGSTLGLSLVVIALSYLIANRNLNKQNESLFRADEILETMIYSPRNILNLVNKFQLSGMVEFILYLSQQSQKSGVQKILPELFYRIKCTRNPHIKGEVYSLHPVQKTKWETIKSATLNKYPDLNSFLDRIFNEAALLQDDVKGEGESFP